MTKAKANALAHALNVAFILAFAYLFVFTVKTGMEQQEYKLVFKVAAFIEGYLIIFHLLLAVWPAFSIYIFANQFLIVPHTIAALMNVVFGYFTGKYYDQNGWSNAYGFSIVIHLLGFVLARFTSLFHTWKKAERSNIYVCQSSLF